MLRAGLLLAMTALGAAALLLPNTVRVPADLPQSDRQFSDLAAQVDALAARPKPVDDRPREEIALDRGFELYKTRGTLDMRRGLTVTLFGVPASANAPSDFAEAECERMKAAIAARCVVLAARATSAKGSANAPTQDLRLSLAFQENKPVPFFESASRNRFRMVSKTLRIEDRDGRDPDAARARAYLGIATLCSSVTTQGKDCSLLAGNLTFTEKAGYMSGEGTVMLGYLVPAP